MVERFNRPSKATISLLLGPKVPSLKMGFVVVVVCLFVCLFVVVFLGGRVAFEIAQYRSYYVTVLYTQNGRRLPGLFVLKKSHRRQ